MQPSAKTQILKVSRAIPFSGNTKWHKYLSLNQTECQSFDWKVFWATGEPLPDRSLWQIWRSCHTHKTKQTWVREWEHLGGGKCDGSQSQLVSAYATLNNAPFQMVNLLNPRLPLAPHSQHARKAPGREHKDSSMSEERPQQSPLLSVSAADALNVSVLQFERGTFNWTCMSHYSSHERR